MLSYNLSGTPEIIPNQAEKLSVGEQRLQSIGLGDLASRDYILPDGTVTTVAQYFEDKCVTHADRAFDRFNSLGTKPAKYCNEVMPFSEFFNRRFPNQDPETLQKLIANPKTPQKIVEYANSLNGLLAIAIKNFEDYFENGKLKKLES